MPRSIFRTYWGLGVIDHVHQRADPENIAEEDELLSQIGTSLPNRREELYGAPVFLSFNAFPRSNTCSSSHPLVGCQPNLTDEGVQMLDEAFVNEALPWIFREGVDSDDIVCQSVSRQVGKIRQTSLRGSVRPRLAGWPL